MRHILVGTDFSKTAHAALRQAVQLASLSGAKVTLCYAIYVEKVSETLLGLDAMEYLTRVMSSDSSSAPYSPTLGVETLRDAAQVKLDDLVAATVADAPNATIETAIVEGRPSEELLAFAAKNGVDLIVIGTHGRGALGKALLGSVADHVIRQADCPVMVVRK